MVLEVSIEKYLMSTVKSTGGICVKLIPIGLRGIPDRLVVLPGPVVAFVELKKPKGGVISKHQHGWRKTLTELGCHHRFIHTRAQVDAFIEEFTK